MTGTTLHVVTDPEQAANGVPGTGRKGLSLARRRTKPTNSLSLQRRLKR